MRPGRLCLAIVTLALVAPIVRADDLYRVIVNSANPVSSLTKAQVSRFFLDKATWDDGQPVWPVDLASTSAVREQFSREVLELTPAAVVARWLQAIKAGRGDQPLAVASDREVLAYVRLKPGAIGYVSAAADTQGVKVISIGGRAAERPQVSASAQQPIEVGGLVPPPEKVVDVPPVYPGIARTARVEGTVDVEVVIGVTGSVERARVVRSIPSLDDAALAAIKKWKYRPTVVNGVPVPVTMKVHVSFAL